MINIVCACITIISMICCIYCVIRLKDVKTDRDTYREWFLDGHKDLGEAIAKWDKTIELCKKINNDMEVINRFNQNLIDINADLRLEIYKMKEKEND